MATGITRPRSRPSDGDVSDGATGAFVRTGSMCGAAREPSAHRSRPRRRSSPSVDGLFFPVGPVVFEPLRNLSLVALTGDPHGTLDRPAHSPQKAADMIHVIVHGKAFANHAGNSRTRPQFGCKAGRLGTAEKNLLQATSLAMGQLRRPSGRPLGSQPRRAGSPMEGFPTTHAASIHPQSSGYLHRWQSLFQQSNGPQPSRFQNFWASRGSHSIPPAQSIGHYLYRSQ